MGVSCCVLVVYMFSIGQNHPKDNGQNIDYQRFTPTRHFGAGCGRKQKSRPFSKPAFYVREIRVELTRPFGHYLLRVARLPIPPSAHVFLGLQIYTLFLKLQKYYMSTVRVISGSQSGEWTVREVTDRLSSRSRSPRSGAAQSKPASRR